jgi:hypothetical protein
MKMTMIPSSRERNVLRRGFGQQASSPWRLSLGYGITPDVYHHRHRDRPLLTSTFGFIEPCGTVGSIGAVPVTKAEHRRGSWCLMGWLHTMVLSLCRHSFAVLASCFVNYCVPFSKYIILNIPFLFCGQILVFSMYSILYIV